MKLNLPKLFLLMLAAAFFFGCDEDEDSSNNTDTGKHRIVLTIPGQNSTLLGTVKDLSVGEVTTGNFYQHTSFACPFVYKDMVFVTEHFMGDVVHKYLRTEDGNLQKAGTMQLPPAAGGFSIVFQSDTKAYMNLQYSGEIYIFNPTTLAAIDTINLRLPEYQIEDSNPDPQGMVLRSSDNRLFVTLSHHHGTDFYNSVDSGFVAIIDANTNTVEKVIFDDRVTSLDAQYNGGNFIDENGDIYFYSTAEFGTGANDGFLRIKAGQTEFDPGYYFSPRKTIVSGVPGDTARYTMKWVYAGNGKVFSMIEIPALTPPDASLLTTKNCLPMMYDLYNKTGTKINLNPTPMFSSTAIIKLDNKIVFGMSSIDGDGFYTYDIGTGAVSNTPVVTIPGMPQFMKAFAD